MIGDVLLRCKLS